MILPEGERLQQGQVVEPYKLVAFTPWNKYSHDDVPGFSIIMLTTTTLVQQRYQYYRAGTDGPLLVFVHGFPMNHALWEPQFLHFAGMCRVLAPDLRGLGGSSIQDPTATISMEHHADDLIALLDQLFPGEPIILAGLSLGGYIAWQFARKYPQRLQGLVLCHTRVVADTAEQAAARYTLAAETLAAGTSQKIEDVMLPRLVPPQADAAVSQAIRQMARSSTAPGLAATLRGLATRPDVTSWLPNIHHPALLISGEYDAISPPAEMGAWAKLLPHARMITLPGVGHVSPLESPAAFNSLLTESLPWLSGTLSR